MCDLKEHATEPESLLLDAGYYSEKNVDFLMDNGINFVCRVQSIRVIYKKMIGDDKDSLEQEGNLVRLNGRSLYIKKTGLP